MGSDYSWAHAACLCAQLPLDSRVARAEGDGWSYEERLLASLEFSARVLRWQPTKDGAKGSNKPQALEAPNELRRRIEAADEYSRYDMDLIAERLGISEDRR